jgi:phosphatidylglycerophosphate synthase
MVVVQPAANAVVRLLARTRLEPWHVVAGHTLLGFLAAGLVATSHPGNWLAAAVLLQVKTVLDNVDGGLARATGRVTEFGRYFDTVCDLAVNVALFAALAVHSAALGSAAAFVIVTLTLSADFGAQKRYEEVRGLRARATPAARGRRDPWYLAVVRRVYLIVLAPQDRAFEAADAALFRLAGGTPWAAATAEQRQRWADLFSTGALVNLGLSTQYLALGVALALGMPYAYVVICWCQLPYLLGVQVLRVARYRAAGRP